MGKKRREGRGDAEGDDAPRLPQITTRRIPLPKESGNSKKYQIDTHGGWAVLGACVEGNDALLTIVEASEPSDSPLPDHRLTLEMVPNGWPLEGRFIATLVYKEDPFDPFYKYTHLILVSTERIGEEA